MKLVALTLVMCAACSGLDAIDHASCGNGIIEDGEDCDSGSNCRQCSIVCTATAPCATGFACGVDGLCHTPSGRFHAESAALPFQVEGFGATDIDADGYNDIVALGGTSLSIHHGDALGHLDNITTTIVPFVVGAPAVTHLDPDNTLDMVIPTTDGLVAYTSRFKTMAPYAFPIEIDTTGATTPKPLAVFTLDGHYLALLVDAQPAPGTHVLGIFILDGSERSLTAALKTPLVPVCAGFAPEFSHDRADSYDTTTSHVIALTNTTGAVCELDLAASATPGVYYAVSSSIVATAALTTRRWSSRLASTCSRSCAMAASRSRATSSWGAASS